ncbi:MAG: hypothetical protein KJ880_01125 [Candidatus Omnitrophica bacterium]|nr:hypothetical protein [Candidatus Omnitrophota bacterium]
MVDTKIISADGATITTKSVVEVTPKTVTLSAQQIQANIINIERAIARMEAQIAQAQDGIPKLQAAKTYYEDMLLDVEIEIEKKEALEKLAPNE